MRKVLLIIMAIITATGTYAASDEAVICRHKALQVALALGQPASNTVNGQLCATAAELEPGKTVQLLIHGASYNYDYWDFHAIDGVEYSYARDVAANGFPTFAFDQLGSGDSSRPPSKQLTIDAAAYVTHSIVQALRSGSIAGVKFGKVIVVGHSLGAIVAWQEAITYGDVDGVIATGAAHSLSSRFQDARTAGFHRASSDPAFAGKGLDGGYLTTAPGVRASLFYGDADRDTVLIISDEWRKDVVAAAELASGVPIVISKATLAIQAPVLTILGSNDLYTCGPNIQGGNFDCSSGAAVVAQEAPFYSARASLHACVVPGSGNDLSLARNRRLQVEDSVAWSIGFVGQLGLDGSKNDLPSNCR